MGGWAPGAPKTVILVGGGHGGPENIASGRGHMGTATIALAVSQYNNCYGRTILKNQITSKFNKSICPRSVLTSWLKAGVNAF